MEEIDVKEWDEYTTAKAIEKLAEHLKELKEAKLAEKCLNGHQELHINYQARSGTMAFECLTCQKGFTDEDIPVVLKALSEAELLPF